MQCSRFHSFFLPCKVVCFVHERERLVHLGQISWWQVRQTISYGKYKNKVKRNETQEVTTGTGLEVMHIKILIWGDLMRILTEQMFQILMMKPGACQVEL